MEQIYKNIRHNRLLSCNFFLCKLTLIREHERQARSCLKSLGTVSTIVFNQRIFGTTVKIKKITQTFYRESLQFADFGANENPRIAKPRISRTPAFGYRCLLKLYQILFTILIGNCLPISIQKVAII